MEHSKPEVKLYYCPTAGKTTADNFNNENHFIKKSMRRKDDPLNIAECFREYSLQDKADALKNVILHNERSLNDETKSKILSRDIKDSGGVKECLKGDQRTPFQTVIWELKNTVMNSYWNKEVGKTRYQTPNLPVGMNPLDVTFGKKLAMGVTVADLINPSTINYENFDEEIVHEMYRKTHNNYYPSEQINRNYENPFSKNNCFGMRTKAKADASRVKNRLTWTTNESNCEKIKDDSERNVDAVYGKTTVKEDYGVPKAICEYFENEEAIKLQKYLQHLNSLRLKFKTRVPEIPFPDVYQDLYDLDQEYKGILPEEVVYQVLAKYRIFVVGSLFTPLLHLLGIIESGNAKYKELVDLLNWRFDIPDLPKINTLPEEHQYYNTTYNEEINAVKCKCENIRAAGLPSSRWDLPFVTIPRAGIRCDREHLGDQTNAYSLVSPSIFTRYGLSHLDFFKTRGKEEIRSIFENIGVQFPNDSFDRLWDQGVKIQQDEAISVETFRNLLSQCTDTDQQCESC